MKKILIIDDDEIFSKILSDSLPKEKYSTIYTDDGEKGLKLIKDEKPDLVLLDLLMPKMGGLVFLENLKKETNLNSIPILISSQLSNIADISEAVSTGMSVGVKGYIIKASENLEMILKRIDKMME